MRMKVKLIVMVVLPVLFFTNCEKTKVDRSYMKVNDSEVTITNAYVEDDGTDAAITYRSYYIKFTDRDSDYPKTYFWFVINSNSTSRLEEGVYQYAYVPEKGEFGEPHVGFDLDWDDAGQAISGTRFSEYYPIAAEFTSGTITISKDDDTGNYVFDFELVAVYNNQTYTISGHVNKSLVEDYIYKK